MAGVSNGSEATLPKSALSIQVLPQTLKLKGLRVEKPWKTALTQRLALFPQKRDSGPALFSLPSERSEPVRTVVEGKVFPLLELNSLLGVPTDEFQGASCC